MAKSSIYESYEQDAEAMEHGIWITDLMIPVPVKIRSFYSKKVRELNNVLTKRYQQAMLAGNGTLPPDKADSRTVELVAKGIVVNWGLAAAKADGVTLPDEAEDMTDREGNVLPYSVEHATRVFKDLPRFRDEIFALAITNETYRKAALDGLKGNSVAPSSPSSPSTAPIPQS